MAYDWVLCVAALATAPTALGDLADLGHDSWSRRERASERLSRLPQSTRGALSPLVLLMERASPDLEVRTRARTLGPRFHWPRLALLQQRAKRDGDSFWARVDGDDMWWINCTGDATVWFSGGSLTVKFAEGRAER